MTNGLSANDKKAINTVIKGCLDACDMKIDDLSIPGFAKTFLKGLTKSIDETASDELVHKHVIKKFEDLQNSPSDTAPSMKVLTDGTQPTEGEESHEVF